MRLEIAKPPPFIAPVFDDYAAPQGIAPHIVEDEHFVRPYILQPTIRPFILIQGPALANAALPAMVHIEEEPYVAPTVCLAPPSWALAGAPLDDGDMPFSPSVGELYALVQFIMDPQCVVGFGADEEIGYAQRIEEEASYDAPALLIRGIFNQPQIVADDDNWVPYIPSSGPVPAGIHRKRYAVLDGWRLLVFATPAEAKEARLEIERKKRAVKSGKSIRLRVLPAHDTVDLKAVRAEAAEVGLGLKFDNLLERRRYGEVQDMREEIGERQAEEREVRAAVLSIRQQNVTQAEELIRTLRNVTADQEFRAVSDAFRQHRKHRIERAQQLLNAITIIKRLRSLQ
jgi:hypothetical protein